MARPRKEECGRSAAGSLSRNPTGSNCISPGPLCLAFLGILLLASGRLSAGIAPDQVLVVYNSAAAEAEALKSAYLAAHPDIPVGNVLDLNDVNMPAANLARVTFNSKVRDPIRNFLLDPGSPQPEDIICIVLIRPLPHRVTDTDDTFVGDRPTDANAEFLAGDASYASVDAELVLLWQDLDAGEAGAAMDSLADNVIDNPYHTSSIPIDTFSRANIQTTKSFMNRGDFAWTLAGNGADELTPGDMYLVCRIDGTTLDDATAVIARAEDLRINRALVRILLDEFDVAGNNELDDDPLFLVNDPFVAGDDYEEARDALLADGWDVRYDDTFDFISSAEETMPLIAYASYGENHDQGGFGENPPGAGTYIEGFLFPPGAIFNTIESFNGRAFNGLGTGAGQEQAADFITVGGSFAVGHVFEPFSFTVPDNEFLLVNFLVGGLTWAEAAYASLPALSWQHVVVGDPLARPTILDDPAVPTGDLDGNGFVDGLDIKWFVEIVLQGFDAYHAAFPALDPVGRADFSGDFLVDLNDLSEFVAELVAP